MSELNANELIKQLARNGGGMIRFDRLDQWWDLFESVASHPKYLIRFREHGRVWMGFGHRASVEVPLSEISRYLDPTDNDEPRLVIAPFPASLPGVAMVIQPLVSIMVEHPAMLGPSSDPINFNMGQVTHLPDQKQWQDWVNAVLENKQVEKVVISRRSGFNSSNPIPAYLLARQIFASESRCYNFFAELSPGHGFASVSPERLYSRVAGAVDSEAVAGTAPRGQTPAEDEMLRMQLGGSEKEIREHQLVIDWILSQLQSLDPRTIAAAPRQVSVLRKVQHLKTVIHADFPETITDGALISALFPTPAVAGFPRDEAIRQIQSLEHYPRQWYGGIMGLASKAESDFLVGIRAWQWHNRTLTCHSGAGIVDGSVPESEWDELNHKIQVILDHLS
ncbi:isochorismate synthase [bacterium]|nr:isochorismate synthase [bacterium]